MEVLRKLWRHRYIVLGCAAVIAGLGALIVLRMPSYYVAEARVLVGVPETRIYNIEPYQMGENVGIDADRVQNEQFIMQSRSLAQQVIDQLSLSNDPEFNPWLPRPHSWKDYLYVEDYLNPLRYIPASWTNWMSSPGSGLSPEDAAKREAMRRQDRIVDVFLNHVDVSTLGRSHVISVQFDSIDPYKAAKIANALAAAYLQQQRQQKVATTNRVESYLTDRIKELRDQVETSEQAVALYRKENGLYNTGKDTGLTSQQLGELNTQLIMAQTAKAEADARLHEAISMKGQGVQGSGPDSVPDVLKNPLIQSLKQQQAQAAATLADLEAQYGPRHPMIVNARAQVADINGKISREMNHVIDGIRQEARTMDARYAALQGDLNRLQTTMGGVNEKTIHLEALERDATVNRNLLEAMLSRLKETYGRQELQQADARLVSEAAPPELPSYPPKGLILALTGAAGLLLGALVALTRENVDRTFRVSEQVEAATGLPVISMVPSVDGATPPTVHVLRHPVSAYSEALRRVHIGLELADPDNSPKTVLFTSAAPAEGKSVMVASLGRLLASNGKRVLLIDCDWRCPNLHRLFRCPNKGGLAALLNEDETNLHEIIYNDSLSGLDLIVAGVWNPQSIHKLTAERMRLILQTFAKNYDIVILDSPPILVGAEVLTLSRMVDKVSFVLRWGHTRREIALEALKQLIDAQGDVAGVVMSRVDPRRYREYAYGSGMNYEYVRPALISVG
ncbi:MAG: AAA family ATPase [Alphaproteobacteria bacterium]|nr:AAA family ATPase [Alphaproteobacteria bacterium]